MMHLSDLVELLLAMMKHLEPPKVHNDPLENKFRTYKDTEQIVCLRVANDFQPLVIWTCDAV